MSASREPVFAALFALLNSLATGATPALNTCSRALQPIDDLQPEELPAAFQLQGDQAYKKTPPLPPVMTWHAQWIVYALSNDPTIAPSTVLNGIVDAAVATLTPSSGSAQQTLGGLVNDCAVDGNIEIYEGLLGNKCVAIIPIRILLPGF